MKLLLIMYSGPTPRPIEELLELHQASGYTELANARGVGGTGRIEGTRAWPGTTTLVLTVVPDERIGELDLALRAYQERAGPAERLHVATLPMERFF